MENKKNDFNLGPGKLTLPNGKTVEVLEATLTNEPVKWEETVGYRSVGDIPSFGFQVELQPWLLRAIEMERDAEAKERMRAAIAQVCGGAQ